MNSVLTVPALYLHINDTCISTALVFYSCVNNQIDRFGWFGRQSLSGSTIGCSDNRG